MKLGKAQRDQILACNYRPSDIADARPSFPGLFSVLIL